jgi:hypothetical protein
MRSFSILFIILLLSSSAIAGTILLLGAGSGTPGGVAPSCSNALDFTDQCNSQYVGTF